MDTRIKPRCDMLIDQNKYIGFAPVGHCCFNTATLSDGVYFICHECAESLKNGDGRVTVPATGSVKAFYKTCHANSADEVVIHAISPSDAVLEAVKLVKDTTYKAGIKEATERMETVTLIIPEFTTKKEILRLMRLEVAALKRKYADCCVKL